ncbi:MAG: hypothetical protein AAFV45_03500 [Pseudomonadota bacterium]
MQSQLAVKGWVGSQSLAKKAPGRADTGDERIPLPLHGKVAIEDRQIKSDICQQEPTAVHSAVSDNCAAPKAFALHAEGNCFRTCVYITKL